MADGVLTPAVSVTSAAAGIAVAKPSTADKITGISLVGIFPSFRPPSFIEDRNRLSSYPFSSRNLSVHQGWVSHLPPVSVLNPRSNRLSYPGIKSHLSG